MENKRTTDAGRTPNEDFASGKPVMELCNHPEYLTDATAEYGGNDRDKPGYLGTHWPAFVTVDLLAEKKVGAICFKLWDWEDPANKDPKKGKSQNMRYAYRLMVSGDRRKWTVLFDSAKPPSGKESDKFRKGWQCFSFEPRDIRFIRIHGLRNLRNSGFHVVKLKAFANASADFFQERTKEVPCLKIEKKDELTENGDGTPLPFRLINFAGQIQEIRNLAEKRVVALRNRKAPGGPESELGLFEAILENLDHQRENGGDVVGRLFKRGHEVRQVEEGLDEIRSLIAEPIQRESEKDAKEARIGFRVDFLFGIFQFGMVAAVYFAEDKNLGGIFCIVCGVIATIVFAVQSLVAVRKEKRKETSPKAGFFRRLFRRCGAETNGNRDVRAPKPAVVAITDSMGNRLQRAPDGHCFAVDAWGNVHGFSADGSREEIWASRSRLDGQTPAREERDKAGAPFATIDYPQRDEERTHVLETLRDGTGKENVFDLFEIEHRETQGKPMLFDTDGAQFQAVLASIPCGRNDDGTAVPMDKKKFVRLMGLRNLALPAFFGQGGGGIGKIFYNEKIGFHSVPTPGWVEFDFGETKQVRYIRFLLWDNAGSGKRQRSHRNYNYRILFRDGETTEWTVLHDTMGHGSCGWQEFICADGDGKDGEEKCRDGGDAGEKGRDGENGGKTWAIRYVRIYGVSNSGTSGAGELQIVRFGISEKPDDSDLQHAIRNRIVKYDGIPAAKQDKLPGTMPNPPSEAMQNKPPDIMQIVGWMRERVSAEEKQGKNKDGKQPAKPDPLDVAREWKDAADKLLVACGEPASGKESANAALKRLLAKVTLFAASLIAKEYTVDSREDENVAKDIQARIAETLKPVKAVREKQNRFEQCMRIPKTILVAVAALPIAADCLLKGFEDAGDRSLLWPLAAVTLVIGSLLVYAIWRPGRIWKAIKRRRAKKNKVS